MDTTERSSKLDAEVIITENISPRSSFIDFKTDRGCGSAKYDLNYKKTKIDESHMPVRLRGKLWMFKRAIGEGKLNLTVFSSIFLTLIILITVLFFIIHCKQFLISYN